MKYRKLYCPSDSDFKLMVADWQWLQILPDMSDIYSEPCRPNGLIKHPIAVPEIPEPKTIESPAKIHVVPAEKVQKKLCALGHCLEKNNGSVNLIKKKELAQCELAEHTAAKREANEHATAQRAANKHTILQNAIAVCSSYREELHRSTMASIESCTEQAVQQVKSRIDEFGTLPPDYREKMKKIVDDAATKIKTIDMSEMSCHIDDKDTESGKSARTAIEENVKIYHSKMFDNSRDFWDVLKEVC